MLDGCGLICLRLLDILNGVEWKLAAEDSLEYLVNAFVEVGREEEERTSAVLVIPIALITIKYRAES